MKRITGKAGGISSIEIQLVMTDRALFQGDSEPARLPGYGIVPAGWARDLLRDADSGPGISSSQGRTDPNPGGNGSGGGGGTGAVAAVAGVALQTWLRRLYTAPGSGDLDRDGFEGPALPRRAPTLPPGQRRYLPHPVLRRPDPTPGPRHSLVRGRSDHRRQRIRTLRSLQLHQTNPRLDSSAASRARRYQ
ncbi:hypothetical protein ABIB26_002554 [Arthrobacter sp. UYEF20]